METASVETTIVGNVAGRLLNDLADAAQQQVTRESWVTDRIVADLQRKQRESGRVVIDRRGKRVTANDLSRYISKQIQNIDNFVSDIESLGLVPITESADGTVALAIKPHPKVVSRSLTHSGPRMGFLYVTWQVLASMRSTAWFRQTLAHTIAGLLSTVCRLAIVALASYTLSLEFILVD